MGIIDAVIAIALLMDFLVGIGCGTFVTVCRSSVIEDKKYSLWGASPGPARAGARILLGFGTRDAPPGGSPHYFDRRVRQGRGVNK
jgi:hypothetical protein